MVAYLAWVSPLFIVSKLLWCWVIWSDVRWVELWTFPPLFLLRLRHEALLWNVDATSSGYSSSVGYEDSCHIYNKYCIFWNWLRTLVECHRDQKRTTNSSSSLHFPLTTSSSAYVPYFSVYRPLSMLNVRDSFCKLEVHSRKALRYRLIIIYKGRDCETSNMVIPWSPTSSSTNT